jgi:CBS domain-containing protein
MPATLQPLATLTANDVMSRDVFEVARKMPLREAVRILMKHHISGAPVVGPDGACVGVISTTDILRWVNQNNGRKNVEGHSHEILFDWQIVEVEGLPYDDVEHFMTPDPVLVGPDTPIPEIAQIMVDGHIHRVIVVDPAHRPIGIVSSTDVLACVARAGSSAGE